MAKNIGPLFQNNTYDWEVVDLKTPLTGQTIGIYVYPDGDSSSETELATVKGDFEKGDTLTIPEVEMDPLAAGRSYRGYIIADRNGNAETLEVDTGVAQFFFELERIEIL